MDSSFFRLKNVPTPLYLSKDKTKRQSGKNATLTSTKTLLKKLDHSLVNFQITLSIYKLDSQNRNYIYNKNIEFFFFFFAK